MLIDFIESILDYVLILSFSVILAYLQLLLICGWLGIPLWKWSKNLFFKLREKRIKHNRFDM